MDLPIAAAYMDVTNRVTQENMETLDILAETRKLKKKAKALEEEGKRLDAEHERLVAEGERLKAEGEAIEAQNERARVHKKSREYYMHRRDTYPLNRKRVGQTILIKHKLDKKIKKMVAGYIFRKSLSNDPIEFPTIPHEHKAITNMLLNTPSNGNQPA